MGLFVRNLEMNAVVMQVLSGRGIEALALDGGGG